MVTDRNYLGDRKRIKELEDEVKKLNDRIRQLESEVVEANRQTEVNLGRSY